MLARRHPPAPARAGSVPAMELVLGRAHDLPHSPTGAGAALVTCPQCPRRGEGPVATLADVRRWNPAAVQTAFAGLGTARDRLLDADAELAAATPPAGWAGAAADGAGREHERLAEQLRRTVAGVSALRPPLAGAADAVADLHRELALVDGLAAARGYRINPDGSVVAPPTPLGTADSTAQLR